MSGLYSRAGKPEMCKLTSRSRLVGIGGSFVSNERAGIGRVGSEPREVLHFAARGTQLIECRLQDRWADVGLT